ncbi:MAG TPA: hypothetical protein VJT54_18110 [Verrucomicrobiae bacterium]|nr:hypothetical protein [Verrucomicrobiae bacterium]
MKYKYRAHVTPTTRGPKHKHFNDREELLLHFAQMRKLPDEIYSREAGGNLKKGDTLDGICREIKLRTQIIELKKELQKVSSAKLK